MVDPVPFIHVLCYRCKEPIWFTRESYRTYQRNSQTWHCLHGHEQHFPPGKTEAEKLRAQLEQERQFRQRAEQRVAQAQDEAQAERRRANGYKGHAAKLAKRAKAGICPCCNRHFTQLARHMAAKHPAFAPVDLEPLEEGATMQ